MSDLDLTLRDIDRDGALAETAAVLPATTRAAFLGGALAVAVGALQAPTAIAATSGDTAILNFALSLEELQAAFYTEAERLKKITGKLTPIPPQLGAVERAHVAAIRKVLGRTAIARPTFDFRGVTEAPERFLKTAVAFEDLAVAAYKGQAINITSPELLSAAVSIHTVEARHAAWMRYLNDLIPAAEAIDQPISQVEARRIVASTGFIARRPRVTTRRRPSFTG